MATFAPLGEPACFDEPDRRRWFLLCKAMETLPLDRALDLARAADEFLLGAPRARSDAPVDTPADQTAPNEATHRRRACGPTNIALGAAQRDELLGLLVGGGKNAELAARFGLTSRQIQGVRMGSAREIAKRRQERAQQDNAGTALSITASCDEIIRFLRQQDDVVVPQPEGNFLVNGRFRLSVTELVERANRMRQRQGKPPYTSPEQMRQASKAIELASDGVARKSA
jgi:hypothetical protein